MSKKYIKKDSGYTIIETMIAVSLFLVVVTIGIGALLNANLLHQKSASMRSITDSLSFVMEDISRNLRTGYNYHCITGASENLPSIGIPQSGPSCWGIAFQPAVGPDKWLYEAVSQTSGDITTYYIRKSTNNGTSWVQLTPDEVAITNLPSVFSVLGAEPPLSTCGAPSSDCQQPLVSIRLVGSITFKNVVTPFSLQTTVSQRKVDI